MTSHIKSLLFGVSALAVIGFLPSNSAAQSTGRAAFAAKQQIKEQVVAAMADGKITQDERRDILVKAKGSLTAEEYFGLAQTMNRLSPSDRPTPENLGYAPYIDKQHMASFPAPDLSWIEKSPVSRAFSQQSFVKNLVPKQLSPKETITKQGYLVRETITKQTIVKETIPGNQAIAKQTGANQSVAKATVARQTVVKAAAPKESVGKTTRPNATAKVVLLPPPPRETTNKQSQPSSVSRIQSQRPESNMPAPPMPPVEQSQTRNTAANKTAQQKAAEIPKKRPATSNQVTLQQPMQLLNEAEKSSIKNSYTDYSVPVLTTPAAALLSDRNHTIQASYDETLEPEPCQGIIRQ